MGNVSVKNYLGWFYLSIAVLGIVVMLFSDTTAGLLVVMLAFLGKTLENIDTIVQELKGKENE